MIRIARTAYRVGGSILVLMVAMLFANCVQQQALAQPPAKTNPAPIVEERIKPGDYVLLRATGTFEFNPVDGAYRIEAGGTLALPPNYEGRVKVAGLTPIEAEKAVVAHLEKIVRNPKVTLTMLDPQTKDAAALEVRVRQLEREVRELRAALEDLKKKR